MALAAQRLRGAQAAQPGADDDDLCQQGWISMACIGQTSAAASTWPASASSTSPTYSNFPSSLSAKTVGASKVHWP